MKLGLALPDLKSLFKRKTRTGVSVYVGDRTLRVLALDEEKKPMFEPVEVIWESDEQAQKELPKVLTNIVESKGLKGVEAISCLQANEGMLKFHKLPANIPKKEMEDAIRFYVSNETKTINEDTVYDYYILEPENEEDKYIRILIAIARVSSIERIKELMEQVGLKLKIIDYEIVAILNYGMYHKLPLPFGILHIDYYDSTLAYLSKNAVLYDKFGFNYKDYRETGDYDIFYSFMIEVRNKLVINEISSIYLAGSVVGDETTLENIMANLPILGILDLENVPPSFFIPYTLSLRFMEGE